MWYYPEDSGEPVFPSMDGYELGSFKINLIQVIKNSVSKVVKKIV